MAPMHRRILPLFGVLVSAAATPSSASDDVSYGILQPTTYKSSSGTYTLDVDPSDRWGNGSAEYRLKKSSDLVWSGTKPYSLRGVKVTDAGEVVGIAYREESPSDPEVYRNTYLHVVILSPSGEERLNREQVQLHYPDLDPEPRAQQVLMNQEHDFVVFRVWGKAEGACGWGGPLWWAYRVSTGAEIERVDPRGRDAALSERWWIVDARTIPGTPFLLLHWFTRGEDDRVKELTGRFALVDVHARPQWTLDVRDDYSSLDLQPRRWGNAVDDFFREHPGILTTKDERRFTLRLFASNELIDHRVDEASPDKWSVARVGVRPWVDDSQDAEPADSFAGTLVHLGPVSLGADAAQHSPFGQVFNFTFDADNNLFYSSMRGKTHVFASVDPAGNPTAERLVGDAYDQYFWSDCPRVKSDQYISLLQDPSDLHSFRPRLVNLRSGVESLFPQYPGGFANSVSRWPGGGFVVVNRAGAASYDEHGARIWAYADEDQLERGEFPTSAAVLGSDRVALLVREKVKILDAQGNLVRVINLREGFQPESRDGRRASLGYLHEVVADADGGFLIKNSENPPVILRYAPDGTLRSKWSPRHVDGRSISPFGIRVDSEGRLWTTDRRVFMRLTDEGVVDQVVGERADAEQLGEVVDFSVDFSGRMYAIERGTGKLHAFDDRLRPVFVGKPNPEDISGPVDDGEIHVHPDGRVFMLPQAGLVPSSRTHIIFDPDGTRVGSVRFDVSMGEGRFGEGWFFQPGTGYRCGFRGLSQGLICTDAAGQVKFETTRRPNGKWFGHLTRLAMSSDGAIAVTTTEEVEGDSQHALDLFSKNGDPIKTIPLPKPPHFYTGLAYDGKRIVAVDNSEVVIVDVESATLQRWRLDKIAPANRSWKAALVADRRELILFDRHTKEIHRFAVPPMEDDGSPQ